MFQLQLREKSLSISPMGESGNVINGQPRRGASESGDKNSPYTESQRLSWRADERLEVREIS